MADIVLVTGGAGFIGHHLTRALLDQGAVVRNLDFVPNRFDHPRLEHWRGSFLDRAFVDQALAGVSCVYHLAATAFPREANRHPDRDADENITGSVRLLQAAVESGVARLIYGSSGGTVYGPTDRVPIAEDHPTNPITAYGISKLAVEKYLRLFDGPMSTLSLRMGNPYGPHQNIAKAQGALTTFCHHAVTDQTIQIWGDGTVQRDFLEISDLTRALIAARHAAAHGTELNIGSGSGTSLNDLLMMISDHLGRPVRHEYLPGRGFDVPRNWLDITRAQQELGWQPLVAVSDGVGRLLDFLTSRSAENRA